MDTKQQPLSNPEVTEAVGLRTIIPQTRSDAPSAVQDSTVVFVDSGTQAKADPPVNSVPSQSLAAGCYILDDQNLIDYFAKPYIISSISWTTETPLTELVSFEVPSDIIAQSPVMLNRIQYWRGFRGDVVFDFEINPAQSQSGKLLCVFQPFTRVSSNRYYARWYHLTSLTQMPKLEIDLATDTGGEMIIPFRLPAAYYPVQNVFDTTQIEDYGTLTITPYAPLRGGGSLTITTRVSFRPETVKLVNPTIRPLVAPPIIDHTFKARAKKRDVEHSVGPVSAVLNSVSRVASTLASVPSFSVVAGPVSWVTAAAAGAASMLGYSNPRQERPPKLVISRMAPDLCTTDQALPAYVYAFTGASRVGSVPSNSLCDLDEMHFSYLLPMCTFESSAVWSTASPVNTDFFGQQVPFDLGRVVTNTPPTAYWIHYAPWRAIAMLFDQYHFSVILKIKIAKTRFHTGKLLVVFDTDVDADAPTVETANPAWQVVIDISKGSEWAIKLPYSNHNHYSNYAQNYGRVHVLVQNQLQAAGGAATAVDLIFETCVDSDASFGYPVDVGHWNTSGGTLPSDAVQPLTHLVTLGPNIDPVSYESACQGDTCHSLRTYLKRGVEVTNGSADICAAFPCNVPWGTISYDNAETETPLHPNLKWISSWYGLYRGTLNYHASVGTACPAYLSMPAKLDGSPPIDGVNTMEYIQFIPSTTMVSLQCPQMALNPWRYTVGYADNNVPNIASFYVPWIVLQFNNANTRTRILTCLGDDFTFAYFLGVEPLITTEAPLVSSQDREKVPVSRKVVSNLVTKKGKVPSQKVLAAPGVTSNL